MWVVFGNRTKVRPVPGGIDRQQPCPACRAERRFVECDVADQVSVFFMPVIDHTTRRLVCTECGEDLEVPAAPRSVQSPPGPARAPEPARPAITDKELEKRLAALKKQMGKK